jgi:hypothetical protein
VLRAIVLGIVQGLTEFLPISSSAHLSIVPRLLGYPTPTLAFEVLLHFGTLAAVVAYFARDLWAFVLCLLAPGRLGPEEAATRRRLLGLLALASVPAAVIGFLVQDWADAQTSRPLRASVWLVATTAILIAAELYARSRARNPVQVAVGGDARRAGGGHPGRRGLGLRGGVVPAPSAADAHAVAVHLVPPDRRQRVRAAAGDRPLLTPGCRARVPSWPPCPRWFPTSGAVTSPAPRSRGSLR